MNLFCKSNWAAKNMKGSSCSGNTQKTNLRQFFFCNVGGCKTQIYLKSLRRTYCKSQLFKVTNKGKPPAMIFSLTCKLLKMDAYSNDFRKIFPDRNPCDCNQIRSNQIAASVNALNWTIFIFNKSKRY